MSDEKALNAKQKARLEEVVNRLQNTIYFYRLEMNTPHQTLSADTLRRLEIDCNNILSVVHHHTLVRRFIEDGWFAVCTGETCPFIEEITDE